MKFTLFLLWCTVLGAGSIGFQNTYGLVEPGKNPNYDAQLEKLTTNFTGIKLADLLRENPQNWFAFSGKLIEYFDPINPATWVIKTTKAVEWIPWSDPDRDMAIIVPPIIPPPVVPCEVTHTCPSPPPCTQNCGGPEEPPPTTPVDVPEPRTFVLIGAGLIGIAMLRRRKH